MINESLQDKIRRGVKVDTSLHVLEREIRLEREAKGLPPEDRAFNPEAIFAEWRHKHARNKVPARKKFSTKKSRLLLREFTICIDHVPAHGYLAYCSAVNGKRLHGETVMEAQKKMTAYLADYLGKLAAQGKPLPRTGTRIKKIKIAAAPLE